MTDTTRATISWREVSLPDFGLPAERPTIPATRYAERCARAYAVAGADWLIVYSDRGLRRLRQISDVAPGGAGLPLVALRD